MKASSENKQKNLAYDLFNEMQKNNLEYTYRGNFSSKISDTILTLAENNLNNADTPLKTRKRVYFIMVEGLQNVTRHQIESISDDLKKYPSLFVVQRKSHGYFITTGNLIKTEEKENITKLITKINSLNPTELKKFSLEILDSGEISSKGGAGLGLVEMARRSKNKLLFDFIKVDDKHLFFYMHTKIPHTDNATESKTVTEDNSLETIKDLHQVLENQNIILNFSGNFTQDTLINLLSIIEKQLQGTVILKMKVFNLMVEMLQNVVKHAENYKRNDVVGKHAIFYISESDNDIKFTTGNYIKNEIIDKFKSKLDTINSLDKDKLADYYNKTEISKFTSKAEADTPEVILDAETGKMSFIGRSIPENAVTFFKPIHEWVNNYAQSPIENTEITFKLDYYNTASDKQIAKLMLAFENISENNKLVIKWKYIKGDYEMMNDGTKYQELTSLNIKLIEE